MATYAIVAGGLNYGDNLQYLNNNNYACFVFDCIAKLGTSLTNTITKSPIESRAYVADHVFNENDEFTLTGVVTNTPSKEYVNNNFKYKVKRTDYAIQVLRTLKESRTPFTLITEFEILDNILIKSLSWDQTAADSEAITFELSLEKVQIVKVATTTVNVTKVADSTTAKNKTGEAGKNAKGDATGKTNQGNQQKSLLTTVRGYFNEYVGNAEKLLN
jgi:hypothetical protein